MASSMALARYIVRRAAMAERRGRGGAGALADAAVARASTTAPEGSAGMVMMQAKTPMEWQKRLAAKSQVAAPFVKEDRSYLGDDCYGTLADNYHKVFVEYMSSAVQSSRGRALRWRSSSMGTRRAFCI
mmetsp:Transcript_96513/g.270122  ORF Transcript_96513/g.270122 Transcript_96513/m.270122 type:complete len:129 (-) Transcript_96513:73-459(-)